MTERELLTLIHTWIAESEFFGQTYREAMAIDTMILAVLNPKTDYEPITEETRV